MASRAYRTVEVSGPTTAGTLLHAAGEKVKTAYNTSLLNNVYIADTNSFDLNSPDVVTLRPLGTYTFTGETDSYALADHGVRVNVEISPTSQITPAPSDIALQIALQGITIVTGIAVITPSGDTSGTTDTSAIQNALNGSLLIWLAPGTYYTNNSLLFNKNGMSLTGSPAAIIQPIAGMTAPMFIFSAQNLLVSNIQVYGGSTTTASNPAVGIVFRLDPGALRVSFLNLWLNYNNGYVFSSVPTGAQHVQLNGIRGTNNDGGIFIQAAGPGSVAAQWQMTDVDLQSCQTNSLLSIAFVTDIQGAEFDGSMVSGASNPCFHILDGCQNCFFSNFDIGGPNAVACLLIESPGGSPSSQLKITDSVFQDGFFGLQIGTGADTGLNRSKITGCTFSRSKSNGVTYNGLGQGVNMSDSLFNNNNQNGILGAADFLSASTGHCNLSNACFASTGVTNNYNLQPTNNVAIPNFTNPGGKAPAGSAPNGW